MRASSNIEGHRPATTSSRLISRLPACSLTDLPRGVRGRVVAIGPERRAALGAHGLRPGAIVHVDGDAPFRGPRIVRLGRARLAISRRLAGQIQVIPEVEPPVESASPGAGG